MKRLLYAFIFFNTTAFGQLDLRGRVVDTFNEPVAGVYIVIRGTIIFTTSKSNGEFELKIPSDSAIVVFSFVGFNTHRIKITKSKTVEIVLQEWEPIPDSLWNLERSKEPVPKEENNFGTVYVYASGVIQLDTTKRHTKFVIWKLGDYKVLMPFDSVVNYLETIDHWSEDIDFGLNFLKSKLKGEKVVLSNEFVKRVGGGTLNKLAINMLKAKTILIISIKGEPINTLIVRDIMWVGRCPNCCWGGIEFKVNDKVSLFAITTQIC